MPTIIHGILTSIFVTLVMGLSPFEFIVKHFLLILLAFWILCAINNLFYYPIFLLWIGPEAELIPFQYVNRISTPSPLTKKLNVNNQKMFTMSNKRLCRRDQHHCHFKNLNANFNEPSLTTITEEPPSWKSSISSISNASVCNNGNMSDGGTSTTSEPPPYRSSSGRTKIQPQTELQSIIVQPEVTVETHHNGNKQNTKVTATANIKVELVTTANGRSSKSTSYHSTSSSNRNNCSSSNNSNSSSSSNNSSNHSSNISCNSNCTVHKDEHFDN